MLAGASKKEDVVWGTKTLFMKLLIGTTTQSHSDQEVASIHAPSCFSVLGMFLFTSIAAA